MLVAAASLVVAPAALGHAILDSASPATQSRVDSVPSEVRLRFNQPVTVTERAIQVLAPDGSVSSGPARSEDGGRVVVSALTGVTRGVAYTVRWRVASSDGPTPAGVFTFGIGVSAPPPTLAVGAGGMTWRDDLARWVLFATCSTEIYSRSQRRRDSGSRPSC